MANITVLSLNYIDFDIYRYLRMCLTVFNAFLKNQFYVDNYVKRQQLMRLLLC